MSAAPSILTPVLTGTSETPSLTLESPTPSQPNVAKGEVIGQLNQPPSKEAAMSRIQRRLAELESALTASHVPAVPQPRPIDAFDVPSVKAQPSELSKTNIQSFNEEHPSRPPFAIPANPNQCPCGLVFTRPEHMRRHRALNICVAGINFPGVSKRFSKGGKSGTTSPSVTGTSLPPETRQVYTVPLPSTNTAPVRRSSALPASSVTTSTTKEEFICPCGTVFSRKSHRLRHQRLNICSGGLPTLEQQDQEEASLSDDGSGSLSNDEAEQPQKLQKPPKPAAHRRRRSQSRKRIHPVFDKETLTCPCGRSFSRPDSVLRHRLRNRCAGGIPPPPQDPSNLATSDETLGLFLDGTRRSSRVALKRESYAGLDEEELKDDDAVAPPKKRTRKAAEPAQMPKSETSSKPKSKANQPRALKLKVKVKPPAFSDGEEPESEDETLIQGMAKAQVNH